MNKKCFIAGFALFFVIISAVTLFYSRRSDQNEEEISELQIMETEESVRGGEQGEKCGSPDEEFEKEKSYSGSVNDEVQIEETGIHLFQDNAEHFNERKEEAEKVYADYAVGR